MPLHLNDRLSSPNWAQSHLVEVLQSLVDGETNENNNERFMRQDPEQRGKYTTLMNCRMNTYLRRLRKSTNPEIPSSFFLMQEALKRHCSLTSSAAAACVANAGEDSHYYPHRLPALSCRCLANHHINRLPVSFTHAFAIPLKHEYFVRMLAETNDGENISGELEITRRRSIIRAGAGMTVPA